MVQHEHEKNVSDLLSFSCQNKEQLTCVFIILISGVKVKLCVSSIFVYIIVYVGKYDAVSQSIAVGL